MKRTSLLKCDPYSLKAFGAAAMTLGEAEGLEAHARSVAIRLHANLPDEPQTGRNRDRLAEVILDEETIPRGAADLDHERAVAIFDLSRKMLSASRGGTMGPIR